MHGCLNGRGRPHGASPEGLGLRALGFRGFKDLGLQRFEFGDLGEFKEFRVFRGVRLIVLGWGRSLRLWGLLSPAGDFKG